MATVRLSKRTVDAAVPKATRYTLFDEDLTGFGLRVFPSGQKSYVIEYRAGEGGRRAPKKRVTIGSTTTLTPDKAREAASKMLARVKLGSDPAAEKQEARQALTLEEVARAFLSEHVELKRKPKTLAHYRALLERLVIPKLGSTKAKDVRRVDVARLHRQLKATPYQANRVLAVMSALYAFAAKRGAVPEGFKPVHGVERYREQGRERFLTVEELERIGAAILEAETKGIPWSVDETAPNAKHLAKPEDRFTQIGPHAAAAIRLLLLTGARLGEILHLRWEQVDFERAMLFLPDSKTGRKPILLNAPAMEVIAGLPRTSAYVIAGNDPEKPRADLHRPWKLIAERAGLGDVRLHDLRHTFASFGAGSGLGLPMIGKLLGHRQASTTQRYAHLDNDPLRRATGTIGSQIANAIGMASGGGEVVPLERKCG